MCKAEEVHQSKSLDNRANAENFFLALSQSYKSKFRLFLHLVIFVSDFPRF